MAPKFKDSDDQIHVRAMLSSLTTPQTSCRLTDRLASCRWTTDRPQCSSPTQLAAHIDSCQTLFLQPESEHTWEKFAKALDKLRPSS